MKRLLPLVVLAIFLAYVAVNTFQAVPSTDGFDLALFGRLPVLVNGRVQPIDSAARLGLLQIRGTVTVPRDDRRSWQLWRRTPAIHSTEWLLETLTKPNVADTRRIFRINDRAVTAALRLPSGGAGPAYHSFRDLEPHLSDIRGQVARIAKTKPADRTASDREWLRLRNAIVIYERLKNSLQPNSFLQQEAGGRALDYDFGALIARYQIDLRAATEAAVARQHGKQQALDKPTEDRMRGFVRPFVSVARASLLSLVPPSDLARGRDRWLSTGTALVDSARSGSLPVAVSFFSRMSTAFARGQADEFNRQIASYADWLLARGLTAEVSRARSEAFYNDFQPFVRAIAVYTMVLLLGCASLRGRSTALHRSAALLLGLAAVLHVTGILFDMMLQGVLPVTNVYSAIIVAGGMAVLSGAAVERRFRNGFGLVAAAVAGLATLVAAHSVAPGGAMALTVAVLDTWLCAAVILTLFLVICVEVHSPGFPRWILRARRPRARSRAVEAAPVSVPTNPHA